MAKCNLLIPRGERSFPLRVDIPRVPVKGETIVHMKGAKIHRYRVVGVQWDVFEDEKAGLDPICTVAQVVLVDVTGD